MRILISVTRAALWRGVQTCGAGLMCVACSGCPAANSSKPDQPEDASLAMVTEDLEDVAKATSNAAGAIARAQRLENLGEHDQYGTLRTMVSDPDLATSTRAAVRLILEGVDDAGELIATRIPDWAEPARRMMVQSILTSGRGPRLLEIPRQILTEVVENGPPQDASDPVSTSTDLAALLLADDPTPEDILLMRAALRESVYSRGLWLALAGTGTIEDPQILLATTVYLDPSVSFGIRAAAAIAAAPQSEAAAQFVETQVESLVDHYAGKDMESFVVQFWSGDEAGKKDYIHFEEQRRLVAMLRYLKTDSAERMIFEMLNVTNEAIRQTAALVALKRWPERLLAHGQGRLADNEYARLMAALVRHHPHLEDRIRDRVAKEHLEDALAKLEEFGEVAIFEWGGLPVAGF